jgi:hypothetical protein
MSEATQVNPTLLAEIVEKCMLAGKPLLIEGPPGVGKTHIVSAAAKKAGYEICIEYTSMSDPTDPKGLPFASADHTKAELLPIGIMAKIFDATKPILLFLDDLGNAIPAVQTAYMHNIYGRKIGDRQIPDCVSVMAATNRISDKSHVHALGEALKSRFHSIVELVTTADDFIKYAQGKPKTFSDRDISFIRNRPSLLHDFTPTKDLTNSPCPRSWEFVAEFFRMYEPELPPMQLLAGAIGEGAAAERMGFERIYSQLPSRKEILENPEGAPVPDDPAIRYALCGMLASKTTKKNAADVFKYFERLGPEFAVVAVKDAIGYNPGLVGTKVFRDKWLKDNPEILMEG